MHYHVFKQKKRRGVKAMIFNTSIHESPHKVTHCQYIIIFQIQLESSVFHL